MMPLCELHIYPVTFAHPLPNPHQSLVPKSARMFPRANILLLDAKSLKMISVVTTNTSQLSTSPRRSYHTPQARHKFLIFKHADYEISTSMTRKSQGGLFLRAYEKPVLTADPSICLGTLAQRTPHQG
jgi:hypothetical protein